MSTYVSSLHYEIPSADRTRILFAAASAVLLHCVILFGVPHHPVESGGGEPVVAPPPPKHIEVTLDKPDPIETEEPEPVSKKTETAMPNLQELITTAKMDDFIQPPHIIDPAVVTLDHERTFKITSGSETGTPAIQRTFTVDQLDQKPTAVATPSPKFPQQLQRDYGSAEVKVSYVVNADGSVSRVKILHASAPGFERAIEDALARWRFRPGMKAHKRVATRVEQVIVFKLEGGS